MDIFSLTLVFFLLANPIGNVPIVVGLLKDFSFEQQKKIMLRECIFAFFLAIFFQFVGRPFLDLIEIQQYTLSIAGGILLFMIALAQIFPSHTVIDRKEVVKEPYFVPIASPIITGGGLMSAIMLYASMIPNPFVVTGAICLAWVGVMPIMLAAPYIQRLLGKQGILALEQFMGLILALLSMELIVKGAMKFMESV